MTRTRTCGDCDHWVRDTYRGSAKHGECCAPLPQWASADEDYRGRWIPEDMDAHDCECFEQRQGEGDK